eukprot:g3111.t1
MRGNTLVYRFCAYGFLKNLKFFEPFLVTVLLKWGLSLTLVGALISVEKVTAYVMELPSGYLSDRWGARKTLCACFVLYICSFLCYYFGQVHFAFLVLASFFFGIAEAARSGAHKSMVFLWLEKHDLLNLKSFLNGRTRSFSLLGSAVAAVGGIFLKLYLDADRTIFLCSIPAYVLDLCVVWSYPSYMDSPAELGVEKKKKKKKKKKKGSQGIRADLQALWRTLKNPNSRRALLATASMGIMHRIFKDYVQPLVMRNKGVLLDTFAPNLLPNGNISSPSASTSSDLDSSSEASETIILGIFYCIFYLLSSPASRNAWRLPSRLCPRRNHPGKWAMDGIMDGYATSLIITGVFLVCALPVAGPFFYTINYVLYNFHKPLSADAISDVAGKHLRATVLSADAAVQTLCVALLAPLAGYIADEMSLGPMFFVFGGASIALNRLCVAEASLARMLTCGKDISARQEERGIKEGSSSKMKEEKADAGKIAIDITREAKICGDTMKSRVVTIMGTGTVMSQVRPDPVVEGMVAIELDWKLAHGSRAVMYTFPSKLLTSICVVLAFCASSTASLVDPVEHAYVYSLNYTNRLPGVPRFEHVHTVTALAGIVNRFHPRLFTPLLVDGNAGIDRGSAVDNVWFSVMTSKGEWLENTTWTNITTLPELIYSFRKDVSRGVVLYDPLLPATSNLASTAAGVEHLLPVLYRPGVKNSVYEQIVASGPKLPVTLDLTSRGRLFSPRTKVNAYRWARHRWLNPNQPNSNQPMANPKLLGYYVDLWAAQQADRLHAPPGLTEVSNHDFFISRGAFFFDLSIWADEPPVDDPQQPLGSDKTELVEIFKAAYALTNGSSMVHVGGFTPWWFKYTQDGPGGTNVSKHKGVETEWETMNVIGAYNAFDDGDACCVGAMANSAFYQHYPLPPKLKQNPKPTIASLHARGGLLSENGSVIAQSYATYYAGDYDGGAWLYNQLKYKWDDRTNVSGTDCVPIGWAVDGELSQRIPVIFKYLYETKGPCDFFISGDSGAGYLNPTLLLPDPATGRRGESNVTKSGAEPWINWNRKWYSKFDVSFTGFLINGDAGPLTNASMELYRSFSPDGVVVSTDHDPHENGYEGENGGAWSLENGSSLLPVLHHVTDLVNEKKVDAIRSIVMADRAKVDMRGRPSFYVLRTILDTARDMQITAQEAMNNVSDLVFVDPYTMGLLVNCMSGLDCSSK